jgi:cell division protein FtsB
MLKRFRSLLTISNGILLVGFLITLSWVWGTVDAIQQNFVLQQRVDGLAQQIAYQELENQTLDFQKKYYQTNEYLELSARERLNLASPDEKALILPPNTVTATDDIPAPMSSDTPIAKRSNIEQWLYFLLAEKH